MRTHERWRPPPAGFTNRSAQLGEAAQSATRQGPPQLYGGGGREVVRSAQEHGQELAERGFGEGRRSPAYPHPWSAACQLSACAPPASATTLRRRRTLLLPVPEAQANAGRYRAEYLPITASAGNLRAMCTDCGTRMYRRVSLRKLAAAAGDLQVALPQAQQRIVEGADPSVNCDLEQVPDAQPGK